MKAIAAVDQNWAIGCKGNLLQHIPEDMRFFKNTTMGKVVIMGRATLDSLPGGQPLKDRLNIVLTKNEQYQKENTVVCHSLKQLFTELEKYRDEDVFVIGGESIYEQLLPYCSEAYITKIKNAYAADKYLMNLDDTDGWKVISEGETKSHQGIEYSFLTYINTKSQNA